MMSQAFPEEFIARAKAAAAEAEFAVCIAVVDSSGLLSGFLRMPGAIPGAIDVAQKKARTAALFQTDSHEIGALAQPGGPIYTLEATNGGLISFGGGLVLRDEHGAVMGALGVAGATVTADLEISMKAAGRA